MTPCLHIEAKKKKKMGIVETLRERGIFKATSRKKNAIMSSESVQKRSDFYIM